MSWARVSGPSLRASRTIPVVSSSFRPAPRIHRCSRGSLVGMRPARYRRSSSEARRCSAPRIDHVLTIVRFCSRARSTSSTVKSRRRAHRAIRAIAVTWAWTPHTSRTTFGRWLLGARRSRWCRCNRNAAIWASVKDVLSVRSVTSLERENCAHGPKGLGDPASVAREDVPACNQFRPGTKPLFPRAAMRRTVPGRLSFDRVATIYDETRSLAPRAMARLLAVLVDEFHRKRVLEIGVGTGRYAVPLQKSGIRVVGVDISRPMVEFGLAKGLRDVVFAEGAHLPFARHSFDIATTNHVLHLIANWRQVFAEIVRVTRELYFTVIERSQRVDSIQRDYDALLREAGYEYHHPGIHERDLPDLVKPDIVIPVGPFHETIPADILLEEFAGRAYSGQWEVPEPIHREAIARLRYQWSGKEYERSYNLEVTFWRIDRIPELAKAKVQKS